MPSGVSKVVVGGTASLYSGRRHDDDDDYSDNSVDSDGPHRTSSRTTPSPFTMMADDSVRSITSDVSRLSEANKMRNFKNLRLCGSRIALFDKKGVGGGIGEMGGGSSLLGGNNSAAASLAVRMTKLRRQSTTETVDGQKEHLVDNLMQSSKYAPFAVLEDLVNTEFDRQTDELEQQLGNSGHYSAKKRNGSLGSSGDFEFALEDDMIDGPDYENACSVDDDEDDDDDISGSSCSSSYGSGSSSSSSSWSSLEGDEFDDDPGTDPKQQFLRFAATTRTGGTGGQRHRSVFQMLRLPQRPKEVKREGALLFVDVSGFTALSTVLDVEALSNVVNEYFDKLVNEVIEYGGDVLKFAGDAFFAEWKIEDEKEKRESGSSRHLKNTDLFSRQMKMQSCVLLAAQCAASIVQKYSDYKVDVTVDQMKKESEHGTTRQPQPGEKPPKLMLNLHCGVGCGNMVGLLVSDFVESKKHIQLTQTRKEFLILGDPIRQVSKAEETAGKGEAFASPEVLQVLEVICSDMPHGLAHTNKPQCIASPNGPSFPLQVNEDDHDDNENTAASALIATLQMQRKRKHIHSSLRRRCLMLSTKSLLQISEDIQLFVHPVIRENAGEKALEGVKLEREYLAEAELRSVYTMFITAKISADLGSQEENTNLYEKLGATMHVVCRELINYNGHLRQFIVDDKGVVLIATFGLRGSTSPKMIANQALPATLEIHQALKTEVGVESRIGGTFGKVYCGVIGGTRRREFAVMGAPVNLAARLMTATMNQGILVNEAVQAEADPKFCFRSLPRIFAKGYEKPVAVVEPSFAVHEKMKDESQDFGASTRKKRTIMPFVGHRVEKQSVIDIANSTIENEEGSPLIVISGKSGIGKSSFCFHVADEIRTICLEKGKELFAWRSRSAEEEAEIDLSAFRKVLFSVMVKYLSRRADMRRSTSSSDVDRLNRSRRSLTSNGTELSGSARLYSGRRASSSSSNSHGLDDGRISDASTNSDTKPQHFKKSGFPALGTGLSFSTLQMLYWVCERIGYSQDYADYLGHHYLTLEDAKPTSKINGMEPTRKDLVDFLVKVYIFATRNVKLQFLVLEELQWVDPFSWQVFREIMDQVNNVMLVCALNDMEAAQRLAEGCRYDHMFFEVVLEPLHYLDIGELLAGFFEIDESKVDTDLIFDIYQKTRGLPAHLVELLGLLKRNQDIFVDQDGVLKWTPDNLIKKRSIDPGDGTMDELILTRFDALAGTVRKVLQTSAVIGMSFYMGDVLLLHPELPEKDIRDSIDVALDEGILIEWSGDNTDDNSLSDMASFASLESMSVSSMGTMNGDRQLEFKSSIWREKVLSTMLEERKTEILRQMSQETERQEDLMRKETEIASQLMSFEYWKTNNDFFRCAEIALAVGPHLADVESLDLYRQALLMSVDDEILDVFDSPWEQLEAFIPESTAEAVIDLVLRLRLSIASCHRMLEEETRALPIYENLYIFLSEMKRVPDACKPLVINVLAYLCDLKVLEEVGYSADIHDDFREEQLALIEMFIRKALKEGEQIYLSRALSMAAIHFGKIGQFDQALKNLRRLQKVYDYKQHSKQMVEKFNVDLSLLCYAQGVVWLYTSGENDEAARQATMVENDILPLQLSTDIETMISMAIPLVSVLRLMDRVSDADRICSKYIVEMLRNDETSESIYWSRLCNPLQYLLEVAKMEEKGEFDVSYLTEMEEWVLLEEEIVAHQDHGLKVVTWMGELCLRLAILKDEEDTRQAALIQKGVELLERVANEGDDVFSKLAAEALLEGIGKRR